MKKFMKLSPHIRPEGATSALTRGEQAISTRFHIGLGRRQKNRQKRVFCAQLKKCFLRSPQIKSKGDN
jgi:hypothetical protein